MYKPLQKKNSSWTPRTAQKKSKSPSKLGHFSIQPKPNKKSSQSPEIGEYSRDSADRLAANVMRSLQAKDSQETETPTVQPQSESRISVADVVGQRMPTVMARTLTPQVRITSEVVSGNPIQRQCEDCASEQQEQSAEAGKEVEQISLAASGIQAKVTVGAPGDKYEVEADTVARQVMSMPEPVKNQPIQREEIAEENVEEVQAKPIAVSITPWVQREMALEKQEEVQAKMTSDGGFETSSNVESQLNASKGGGSPLSNEVRSFMEPRFGADFTSVRVHTDSAAVQMSQELGAQAFTHGSDVYFGEGKSPGNNELTAHELTHVVQQNTGTVQRYRIQRANLDDYWDRNNPQHDPSRVSDSQIKATDDYQHLLGLRGQVQPAYSVPETLLACRLALRYMRENRVCITREYLETFLPQAREQLGTLTSVQSLQGNLSWSGQAPGLQGTEFGRWLLGGGTQPDPQSGNMNCWEVILFGAFRGGFISENRLRTFYQNFAADVNQQLQAGGNPTQYFETQLRSSNEYRFNPANQNTPEPLPGDIVIFRQAAAHAAISLGTQTANGEHEVLSLWNTPNNNLFLQRTTIEALLGAGADSPVKFWSPRW